ncbi:MAG: ABC transporter ATP-binding protein [Desulfovibrionaceae bacterium]|nr:ABC transporter ATP-binding protein [Desulfovibrionaceae bacterium]
MNTLRLLFADFRRIMGVLPPHLRRSVTWLFAAMVLLGIVELLSIISLTGFFTVVNTPAQVVSSRYGQKLLEWLPWLEPVFQDYRRLVLWACLMPIGFIVGKNAFAALVAWRSALLGERVAAHVGMNVMRCFLYMPYSWHLSAQSSQALTCMQWRFNLGQLLLNLMQAYSNIITVTLLFCGLAFYEPGVTLFGVAFMMIASWTTYNLLRKRVDRAAETMASAQMKENTATVIAMGGVRELLIYQRQPVFLEEIARHVHAGMRPRSFVSISPGVPAWTLESSGFFLIWLAIYLLIHLQDASLAAITTTVALLVLTAWRVLPSLNRVLGATVNIRSLQPTALPCLDYFEKLSSLLPETAAEADPEFKIRGEIVFDKVSYRYPGAEVNALSNISCRIPLGATLGLVGRSGAGKSTFINILSGLLEPTEGRLLVDGEPMSAAELAAYRRQLGYVPQTPYLLPGTVAQNVAFSDWGNPPDMERVRRACREAAIDFLGPDCEELDRPVSAGGSGFSGGQMQRISIARALYVNPGLLIFDEATSALDQASEAAVQDAVVNSRGRRISVIAAHRLSTLEICDSVLWLEGGKVKDTGDSAKIISAYKKSMEELFSDDAA